ncbi:hypothetical protein V5799_027118 [Amblyomma americanum]|uniref:Uncharacterized protein n=1 Tax=Amblyomma americanum TaxID=6943 RepID=A0AAQ4DGM4_AMBAM
MSTAEMNLTSGLWLMLFVQKRVSGWPVRDLMASLGALVDDEQLAPYLAPGAENKFRRFVREMPAHFHYDAQKDTVALVKDSQSTAADQWLVRYLAQQIQASEGGLEMGAETSAKCQSAVLKCMADHLGLVYGGNLNVFFRTHPRDFIVDESGTRVRLPRSFHEESMTTFAKEENLVLFFIDLLQKVGATKDKPCNVHTLTKYLPFVKSAERNLLQEGYRGNLNAFFLLNPAQFATTKAEKGSVFLKNHDPDYGLALFLKQQVHILSTCASGHSAKVPLTDLASRVKHSPSPIARPFFGVKSVGKKLRDIARRHPALFHIDEPGDKLWLREECPPRPEGQWNADAELLSVAYFVHVLKHIDATSPTRAICFNYIVRAASAAPPCCKEYLESAYPALEVIGLFHLYPGIFDLSSVNRVCLKTTEEAPDTKSAPADPETESNDGCAEKQAALYAAKLLKYVPDLNPDLLAICVESGSLDVRNYCMATVKGRLQSVIKSGRAALSSAEWAQLPNPTQASVSEKTTSEASTQTVAEPMPLPVKSEPDKKAASKKKKTVQDLGQKANVPTVLVSKTSKKKAAKVSVVSGNAAHKVSVVSASPGCSNSTAVSGTEKPQKAEQQIVLFEQAQTVGGQIVRDELLAVLERLAKLSPQSHEDEASAEKLPHTVHTIKDCETGKTSKTVSKITMEVSKVTMYKTEDP